MGEVNKVCYQILNELLATTYVRVFCRVYLNISIHALFPRCNTMLFSSEPLSQARDYLDSFAQLLKVQELFWGGSFRWLGLWSPRNLGFI